MKKDNLPLIFNGITTNKNTPIKNNKPIKTSAFQTGNKVVEVYYKKISNFKNV